MQQYGNADRSVSQYLKAWIKSTGGDIQVCGLIGPGTSRSLQANWNSPFEQSNVGSAFDKIGGVVQAMSDRTSQSTFNSTQVWDGNRPVSFNLNLIFYALANPMDEVVRALAELERMASPELSEVSPTGRIPGSVTLNIGRNCLVPDCVIESISSPLDKERDRNGLLLRAEVTIALQTKTTLSKKEIMTTWGV